MSEIKRLDLQRHAAEVRVCDSPNPFQPHLTAPNRLPNRLPSRPLTDPNRPPPTDPNRRHPQVGSYLVGRLKDLQSAHPHVIGDVRGRGLFVGIEIVRDGLSKLPAPATAKCV
jgi:hypothetical protein